jgi:hypothetical protein
LGSNELDHPALVIKTPSFVPGVFHKIYCAGMM